MSWLTQSSSPRAGLHQDVAIELGKFGVTVNAVAPGFIETDMTVAAAARAGVTFEGSKAPAAAQVPVDHAGQPGDVAATVAFFVRDESSFVSDHLRRQMSAHPAPVATIPIPYTKGRRS